MLRGLYTAATGMIHQRKKLDTIANNLSNVNTRGYKKDDVVSRSFKDELLLRTGGGAKGAKAIGPLNHGVYAQQVATFFQDGVLQHTGQSGDLALQGDGFFTILTDSGPMYTRDGSFKVNQEGVLVTSGGQVVSGEYGPIVVGQEDFVIDEQGNVFIDGSLFTNRLELTNFEDPSLLEKVGDNLFANNNP
ncbi:MAG TPA: flagellar hook-basal body protein, partial [Clostridia bacterium]|nr:flagellar hook-basal body protein [Clostridia bacterium]